MKCSVVVEAEGEWGENFVPSRGGLFRVHAEIMTFVKKIRSCNNTLVRRRTKIKRRRVKRDDDDEEENLMMMRFFQDEREKRDLVPVSD